MKLARATQYLPTEVDAAHSVLIELGVLLKDWQERVVLIGGFVPSLLLSGSPQHIGTLDVDINLDLEAFADVGLDKLRERLEQAGYKANTQPQMPFRWQRVLPHSNIAVLVDLLAPEHQPKINGVLAAKAAHLALQHHQVVRLEGMMPNGQHQRVQWRVASLPALFVMKGHSVSEARAKDAYDIYHVLRLYPGGSQAFAKACIPLLQDTVAKEAFVRIQSIFRSDDDLGAQLVGSFLLESDGLGELSEEQVMQDAYQRVRQWAVELGLTNP
jgi:hypothetical protein